MIFSLIIIDLRDVKKQIISLRCRVQWFINSLSNVYTFGPLTYNLKSVCSNKSSIVLGSFFTIIIDHTFIDFLPSESLS